MIKVDISNVWGQLALPDLLALEKEVSAAHKTLMEGTGEGNDFLGWLSLPTYEETEEMRRIAQAAARIRESSEVTRLWSAPKSSKWVIGWGSI